LSAQAPRAPGQRGPGTGIGWATDLVLDLTGLLRLQFARLRWFGMGRIAGLLAAYAQQLRTDAQTRSALAVVHLGHLRLVTFPGDSIAAGGWSGSPRDPPRSGDDQVHQ